LVQISRKSFDQLVEHAIASLPAEFARWLDEVPVIVEDAPTSGDVPHNADDDSEPVGIFAGPSMEEGQESGELPPRIMIYRQPLMEACPTVEQLAEEIRKTLVHELGHYAGMDEEELRQRGYGDIDDDGVEWDVD
jgi:predicted Zn-dependent protease with MMP-like domain